MRSAANQRWQSEEDECVFYFQGKARTKNRALILFTSLVYVQKPNDCSSKPTTFQHHGPLIYTTYWPNATRPSSSKAIWALKASHGVTLHQHDGWKREVCVHTSMKFLWVWNAVQMRTAVLHKQRAAEQQDSHTELCLSAHAFFNQF